MVDRAEDRHEDQKKSPKASPMQTVQQLGKNLLVSSAAAQNVSQSTARMYASWLTTDLMTS